MCFTCAFYINYDIFTLSDQILTDFAIVTDYTHSKIYQISSDGQTVSPLDIRDISQAACAIYDADDDKIYYAEPSSRQIKSVTIDGANESIIYTPGQ